MPHLDRTLQTDPRWLELVLERERLCCFGAFTQGLIHNINGPLQNISMLAELIHAGFARLDSAAGAEGDEHAGERSRILERERGRLQKLSDQVSLLDGMLRDLRLLHEIEHNPTEVDLNLLVSSLAQIFRCDLFFKHHVHLELNLANDLPLVRVLARHLIPALVHLFRNAMTALREAPEKRLVIESRTEGERIWLSLRDSGCGLPPGEEERCFEPFYSGWPPVLQTQEPHHGVGLYLASLFLEPYAIKVRLQTQGQETVATLEIPVKSREAMKP
jgi:signal transduction histidine kinase